MTHFSPDIALTFAVTDYDLLNRTRAGYIGSVSLVKGVLKVHSFSMVCFDRIKASECREKTEAFKEPDKGHIYLLFTSFSSSSKAFAPTKTGYRDIEAPDAFYTYPEGLSFEDVRKVELKFESETQQEALEAIVAKWLQMMQSKGLMPTLDTKSIDVTVPV